LDALLALTIFSMGIIFYCDSVTNMNYQLVKTQKQVIESRKKYEKKKGIYND
jgi:hypothetical protein